MMVRMRRVLRGYRRARCALTVVHVQVPETPGIVVGDAMWVVYSVGKEDVAVSRVPLSALGR